MDAGAVDPLRAARPEEGDEKPKPPENQDDGYETSNSGEAARRKPSSAEGSPAPPPEPSPPPDAPYEPLMRYPEPEPEPYRHFEPPAPPPPALSHQPHNPHQPEPHQYQHFPFKYNDPYSFKRDDLPYDMSQHPHQQYGPPPPKRDDDIYNGIKRECDDPYSFVEEEAIVAMLGQGGGHLPPHLHPDQHAHMMHPHQMMLNQPKKRGRKKKIKDENGMELKVDGLEGALVPRPVKERKKHDRFNGMSEEEVARRTLPDHLAENLDIIIIGINPGLFAAYKGHHYAGPGNHFWKCLYLSGLTREQMSADEDYKLLNFGIGFTNMVPRATKGSADLTRREIKEGSAILLEKLQTFRPKVAVFNGKLIYEVFSGKKDFCFGKQPDTIAGTNTYMWVMPSSSARCAQLPRAADKVPFYAALKKFRDYLNGLVGHIDESELVFPDTTGRRPQDEIEIRRYPPHDQRLTMEPEPGDTMILEDGTEVPLKKKRGRPKKVKLENGETAPPVARAPRTPRPPALDPNGEQPPKKKRGRPKKIRPEEQQFLLQQQQQQQQANSMVQQQSQLSLGVGTEQGYMPQHAGDFPQQLPSPLGGGAVGAGGVASGGGLLYQHQQNQQQQAMAHNDNYFQPQAPNPGMDSPLEASSSLGALGRGYGSPGGGFCASPRGVYASPRSQGYSPSPARPAGTPQPQFPSSPAAFNAPSPPRVGGGAGSGGYHSPAGRGASFSARSPLYAHSPAHQTYQHPHTMQNQPSPATQNRFSQSPHPHPYSRSPAPQPQGRPYSRSPAPSGGGGGGGGGGTTPFGAASPAGALPPYTPSPAHTPYSHHSSPAPPRTPTYTDTAHHYQPQLSDVVGNGGGGNGGGFGGELSSEIGAAISSPAPVSPGMALDFEPPRDPDPVASPMGSTDMHPGSNSNSSLSDYNKTSGVGEMSPGAVGNNSMCGGLYEGESRMAFAHHPHTHSPHAPQHSQHSQHPHNAHLDKRELYQYNQEQGNGVGDSPRLDQLHQHPSMYPSNFNSRSTPPGGSSGEPFSPMSGASFRPPEHPHTPHTPHTPHNPGSPGEYGSVKPKSQDVASKSLSGLESLVDQIPSIAEGPGGAAGVGGSGSGGPGTPAPPAEQPAAAPVASLPEYAPALYPPYGAYGGAPYTNNGYGGPFVGYGGVGGWGGAVMRPTPGYLSEWQYPYPAYNSPYNNPYYNGYAGPPPAHHQQAHYLSAPPLIDLHKNGEHSAGMPAVPSVPSVPSVGFGGFC